MVDTEENIWQIGEIMYTIEVYKKDRRTRNGSRSVAKWDTEQTDVNVIEDIVNNMYPVKKGYSYKLSLTMVQRKNFMTGDTFMERYDTPRFCSPASESFWSM